MAHLFDPLQIRGVTFRITPVSLYSMLLMTGEPEVSVDWLCCVRTGTWSPTCSRAV